MQRLASSWLLALIALIGCNSDPADDSTPGAEVPESRTEVALPGNNLYPEGIAAHSNGTLFVGSLTDGSVLRIPPGRSTSEVFVPPGELGQRALSSVVGLLIDEELDVLWACDGGGIDFSRETAVVGFALSDGHQIARHPFPTGTALCNDLALDQAGNLYATDSFGGRVLRVASAERTRSNSLQPWAAPAEWRVEAGQFGPNGVVAAGNDVYVAHTQNQIIYRVALASDGSAGAVSALPLDRAPNGLDGMKRAADGGLVFVEGYAEQLVHVALGEHTGRTTVLRAGLNGPTTFAFSGQAAWIVEGQLPHLFTPDAGPPDLPFRIVRVALDPSMAP